MGPLSDAEHGGADREYGGGPHRGGPSGKTPRRPRALDVMPITVKSEIGRAMSIDGFGGIRVAVHADLNRCSGSDERNRDGNGGHTERRQKSDQPK